MPHRLRPCVVVLGLLAAVLLGLAPPAGAAPPAVAGTQAPVAVRTQPLTPSRTQQAAHPSTQQAAHPSTQQAAHPSTRARGCTGATDEEPVRVLVTTLLPQAPTSTDDKLQVRGTLTNCGDRALDELTVRLSVDDRISRRSGLASADQVRRVGRRRLPATGADRPTLAAGASTTFATTKTIAELGLGTRNGVFPLTIEARGRLPGAGTGSLGLAATFLPWFPDGPVAPTRVAWLLPLVEKPRRTPDEVFLDDELAGLVADSPRGSGRLQRALASGVTGARDGDAAITYAVDPDLLDSLAAMTSPYRVRARRLEVRPASADATRWLATLRRQVQDPAATPAPAPSPGPGGDAPDDGGTGGGAAPRADVLALPYADPDVASLARSGSGLRDDVDLLRDLGNARARQVLDVAPLAGVAFPPPGPVGTALDTLVGDPLAPAALVLSASAFSSSADGSRTPNARTTLASTVAGPVAGLVVEPTLSELVEADPSSPTWQGPLLAEQRFLAEAAAITAERPSESRTIVVAPRRGADLVVPVAAGAIRATGTLPFLCAVPLRDVAAGTERCPARRATGPAAASGPSATPDQQRDDQPPAAPEDRGRPLSRPVTPTGGRTTPAAQGSTTPLPASYLAGVARVRAPSDQFTDEVLLAGSPESAAERARLLRARGRVESAAWRADLAGGNELLALLGADVRQLRGRIVLRGAPVLLTGRSGIVRVSVENSLAQPVNIGVRLEQTAAARLVSDDTAVAEVPGASARQINIRVTARTSGRFTAEAVLVGRDGKAFGAPEKLQVTSSGYGPVALGVTGLAAAVLFLTVAVRLVRRLLHRGRAA